MIRIEKKNKFNQCLTYDNYQCENVDQRIDGPYVSQSAFP